MIKELALELLWTHLGAEFDGYLMGLRQEGLPGPTFEEAWKDYQAALRLRTLSVGF